MDGIFEFLRYSAYDEPMQPRTPIIARLLTVLSFTGIAAALAAPTTMPTTAPDAPSVFRDPKHGFAIAFPTNWTLDKPFVGAGQIGDTPFSVHAPDSVEIHLWIEVGRTNLSPDEIAQQAHNYASGPRYENMDPITEETTKLDGTQAWKICYVNPKPKETKEVRIFAVKDGNAVSIRVEGPPQALQSSAAQIDGMVRAFHWITVNDTPALKDKGALKPGSK